MSRRKESLLGYQCEHSTQCLVVAFNQKVYLECIINKTLENLRHSHQI